MASLTRLYRMQTPEATLRNQARECMIIRQSCIHPRGKEACG